MYAIAICCDAAAVCCGVMCESLWDIRVKFASSFYRSLLVQVIYISKCETGEKLNS